MQHPATDPEVRKTGLGGSDMATVLGLNPYSSPFELWLSKRGRLPDFQGNEATWFGNQLEDILARRWASDHEQSVQRKNVTARHSEHEWAFAHIDRKVVGERACLEIKTTLMKEDWGEEWTDEIPAHVLAQAHHQMWVEDFERCYVTVAFLQNRTIKNYQVERNLKWDQLLRVNGEIFWDYVETETEPPIDYSTPGIVDVLGKAYPISNTRIEFSEHQQEMHNVLLDLKERATRLSKAADTIRAELLHATGEAAIAALPDGTFYARTISKRKGFTVEPTTVTNFRHLKKLPKGMNDE